MNKHDFEFVLKNKKVFHGDHFYLVLHKPELPKGLEKVKFSAVVSSKILKKAVDRNKLRRRMNEASGDYVKSMKNPAYMALFAKTGSGQLKFSEIRTEVSSLFAKISV
jgi:ribonuclease P protein component